MDEEVIERIMQQVSVDRNGAIFIYEELQRQKKILAVEIYDEILAYEDETAYNEWQIRKTAIRDLKNKWFEKNKTN